MIGKMVHPAEFESAASAFGEHAKDVSTCAAPPLPSSDARNVSGIDAGSTDVTRTSRRQAAALPRGKVVYFATAGVLVKIGRSADVRRRLRELRTKTGFDIRIAATTPGGTFLEGSYHRQYDQHRLDGEWFARCPEIDAEIDRLSGLSRPAA